MSEERYREDNTAGAYLTQAREALLDCGRASKLYGGWVLDEPVDSAERMRRHLAAQDTHLGFASGDLVRRAVGRGLHQLLLG